MLDWSALAVSNGDHILELSCHVGESLQILFKRTREPSKRYKGFKARFLSNEAPAIKAPGGQAVFSGKAIGRFEHCLSRQMVEGVQMRRCPANLRNTKYEWHQAPIWRIKSEILRGELFSSN